MNFSLLKQLYCINSKSGFEGEIIAFIYRYISTNVPEARIDMDYETGNMYITKGESDTYPCVVAHLDQVQKEYPGDFTAVETRHIIFGYSPSTKKHVSPGCDDKNGIWIALKLLKRFPVIKCAFFVGEEIGCIGSEHARMDFFKDTRFVLQGDRRGSSDLIVSIFNDLCSEEFLEDINFQVFGYAITDGLSTDVGTLKDNGLGVSCINASCGYYNPHDPYNEYTVKKDLVNCLRFFEYIIEHCTKVYHHTSELICGSYGGYCSFGYWDEYDELYDIISEQHLIDPTITPDEVYNFYHQSFPHLKRDDFASILQDVELSLRNEDEDPDWAFSPAI